MPADDFDEWIAPQFRQLWPHLFSPEVVDPTVAFLADHAGAGPALPFDVSPGHVGFDEIDVATQTSWSHHHWFLDGETKSLSAPFRYVWPSELDLMARLAGLKLRERWSSWDRTPFTSADPSHISVWEKAE